MGFDTDDFASKLQETYPTTKMTVGVVDNDLLVVIEVRDEDGDVIGRSQFGEGVDSLEDWIKADVQAEKLVDSLLKVGVQAKPHDFDKENQW